MINNGDEICRTQHGNNNAYCQDNALSWFPWNNVLTETTSQQKEILDFTRQLLSLRREHIVFRRSRFFHGNQIPGTLVKDVSWLKSDGSEMVYEDWENPELKTLGVRISGEAGNRFLTERGEPEPDDTFLLILNAGQQDIDWTLPPMETKETWQIVVNTAENTFPPQKPVDHTNGNSNSHKPLTYRTGENIPSKSNTAILLVLTKKQP